MLFSFVGGPGHFDPLAPLARAARRAGHEVAVACGRSRTGFVESLGFTAIGIGIGKPGPRARKPLLEVDMAREERDLRQRLVGDGARQRRPELQRVMGDWAADVVVADETDFGAGLAAQLTGIPHAVVLVLAAGTLTRPEVVADELDQVRQEAGLDPDPDLRAPTRYLTLCPFPPALRSPRAPLPATTHWFRPRPAPPVGGCPPPDRARRKVVYFTLGTEFNVESGDLFLRVTEGLRRLHADIVVTVGRDIDPDELGPQPQNVRVAQFIPQHELLPRCDLVVCHGGSGTVNATLSYGLPLLTVAMGADQPPNAERCEELGVGINLDPVRATPDQVLEAATALLGDPSYRHAALAVQAEIAAMPDVTTTVPLLERLAIERVPILSR